MTPSFATTTPQYVDVLHQTVRGVAEDIEELRYNTAISKLMEYVNVLRGRGGEGGGLRAVAASYLEPLMVMLSPFAPHFAEECWERLGHETGIFQASWPEYEAELARETRIELVVQVNGKVRGRLQVAAGISKEAAVALALEDEGVKRFVDGEEIKKTIYVQDRLVNLVI